MAKSIIESNAEHCFSCSRGGCLEEHHIFFGSARRKLSEKYGLKVHLCIQCHRDNKKGVHGQNIVLDRHLKQIGQQAFEREHTRKEFMDLFSKNYLD